MSRGAGRLTLDRDGRGWPNRDHSRIVEAGGLAFHVLEMGSGPTLLLLHGTGASAHSWRALAPLLAQDFRVIAPDLPGHGFSDPLPGGRVSLPRMADALAALLAALNVKPDLVAGHSAGAAIAVRMCLDRRITPKLVVALNGALLPFDGVARHLFPSLARWLFLNPLVPRLFAWSADRKNVMRLLAGTGSHLDPAGVDLYLRLFANAAHVENTLAMMADWDLERLQRDITRLEAPLVLVAAAGDKAVPPDAARRLAALRPGTEVVMVGSLGHLAHEEDPAGFAALMTNLARGAGILPADT